ncbi:19342_t:CDS:2 [Racocetra persica]|uniref:19342_t:CDS:1 n=1 Tax=Racocetra persica TaxID=160502 RepID=A0ACA9MSB6_9GLOM|nr:19342_t:CDS:2 [Racocetra persica]
MNQPINQVIGGQPLAPQNVNIPVNQVIGGQPLAPQNANIPVNQVIGGQPLAPNIPVTAEQMYDITKGADPFSSNAREQEAENQANF